MGWLLKIFTGNPLTMLWVAAAIAVAAGGAGGLAAWKVQGYRLDALQTKYDSFVERTDLIGQQAIKDKKKQDDDNKLNTEKANAKLAEAAQAITVGWSADRAELVRLRKLADSSGSAVRKVAVDTGVSCDQAANDRISAAIQGYIEGARSALTGCQSAARDFRDSVAQQLEQADSNTAALVCGVGWAAGIAQSP